MTKKKYLIGERFGTLVVVREFGRTKEGRVIWLCKCSCGEERTALGKDLGKKVTRCRKKCTLTEDLSGKIFGYLSVIRRVESDKHGFARFLCRCINQVNRTIIGEFGQEYTEIEECGNELLVNGISLRSFSKNEKNREIPKCCFSCSRRLGGQLKSNKYYIDLTGQTFGRLIAQRRFIKNKRILYECICACGSIKKTHVRQEALIGKNVKPIRSCGCLQREYASNNTNGLIHGLSGHSLYHVWSNMKGRCENPNNPAYARYGGREIKVCEEWQDFEIFYKWAISNGWQDGLSIDRIDNDKSYNPENCQILSRFENIMKMHRDHERAVFFQGQQINILELSKKSQVPTSSCKRLILAGYSLNDVLLYSKLRLHQKQAIGRSINSLNPISINQALQIKQIFFSKKKQSSEMGSYRAMISRCYNQKDPAYKYYGAKGISVCVVWKKNPKQFLKDMGPKPSPKSRYAIDRIDSQSNYTPQNCRWLTISENSKKRNSDLRKRRLLVLKEKSI